MIEVTGKKETAADNNSHTIDAIDSFVQTSPMSQKSIHKIFNERFTSRKKFVKHLFYQLLGYT